MRRVVIQRVRGSEVKGRHFGVGHGSALRRPFISMLCEWDKAGHRAPEDSLTKKSHSSIQVPYID